MRIVTTFAFLIFGLLARGQSTKQDIKANSIKGDIILDHGSKNVYNKTIKIYPSVNKANKEKVLLINKYIDTAREIDIKCGLVTRASMVELRDGLRPLGISDQTHPIIFFVKNNQIFVSGEVYGLDGKLVAKISENRLVPEAGKRLLHQRISERFIEVFDDYNVPVFQLILDSATNSIIVNGLYFSSSSCILLNGSTMYSEDFKKPFLLMSQAEKDSAVLKCNIRARKIIRPLYLD